LISETKIAAWAEIEKKKKTLTPHSFRGWGGKQEGADLRKGGNFIELPK